MKITATLLKFGEDSTPDGWGDVVSFAPDSLYVDARQNVPLIVHHDQGREAVGYATKLWTEGDLVRAEFQMLDTPRGLALQSELSPPANLRLDVSIGVNIDDYDAEALDPDDDSWMPAQRLTVSLADLVETSLCFRGRMPSAQVDDVSTTDEGNPA